jgi:hypothetical protein
MFVTIATITFNAILPFVTERRDRVINAPASYSRGPGFDSWPQQQAILISCRDFPQIIQEDGIIP